MATSPDILTARLRITLFAERHLTEKYIAWLNDKHLMRFSEQRHRTHTQESCRLYLESFSESPNLFWAIEEHVLGLGHIGNMNAYVDENNRIADVGILIGDRRSQHCGYGTEAWKAVCDYLFRGLGMRKVTAGTLAGNSDMLRIMQSSGMEVEGRLRRHYLCEGEEMDLVYAAVFREDWLQRPPCASF